MPPEVLQSEGQLALVSPLSQIQFLLHAPPVEPLTTHEPAVPAGGTYHVHPGAVQVACDTRLPQPVAAPPQSAAQLATVSVPLQIRSPQTPGVVKHGLDACVA